MMCLGIESAIFKDEKGLQMQGSGSDRADSGTCCSGEFRLEHLNNMNFTVLMAGSLSAPQSDSGADCLVDFLWRWVLACLSPRQPSLTGRTGRKQRICQISPRSNLVYQR